MSIPNVIVAVSISVAVLIAAVVGTGPAIRFAQDAVAMESAAAIRDAENGFFAVYGFYPEGDQLVALHLLHRNENLPVFLRPINGGAMGSYFCVGVRAGSGTTWYGGSISNEILDHVPAGFAAACPTAAQVKAGRHLQ
ncbi:hypothetical protein [Agromyces humi]|uniref:hypothetical protein n=1 Tax=Agromyces humi TaxID=1766800 RepID=UPI00135B1FD0|nr:hypothetical protein [Agromyces humi]